MRAMNQPYLFFFLTASITPMSATTSSSKIETHCMKFILIAHIIINISQI